MDWAGGLGAELVLAYAAGVGKELLGEVFCNPFLDDEVLGVILVERRRVSTGITPRND